MRKGQFLRTGSDGNPVYALLDPRELLKGGGWCAASSTTVVDDYVDTTWPIAQDWLAAELEWLARLTAGNEPAAAAELRATAAEIRVLAPGTRFERELPSLLGVPVSAYLVPTTEAAERKFKTEVTRSEGLLRRKTIVLEAEIPSP